MVRRALWTWVAAGLFALVAAMAPVTAEPSKFSASGPRQVAPFEPTADGAVMPCMVPPRPGTVITPAQSAAMKRLRAQQMSAMRAAGKPRAQIGSHKVVVLLVDFSDSPGTRNAQYFRDLLFSPNQPGAGSMHDFYARASHGQVDFSGTVVNNGVTDWFRASQTKAYYEANNGAGLLREIILAADPYIDYSQFDENADGVIEHLIIIWAGPDTGWGTFFWPHASGINVATADGVRTGGYNFVQEDFPMGTYAHEMGHNLGLPDLYDYDSGAAASQGVGGFCLMAGGSWGGGGADPSVPSAWCRYALGWETPTNVTGPINNRTLVPADAGGALPANLTYRLWRKGQTGGSEYFIIENRQQSVIPGQGLLVWHVDESVTNSNNDQWYPGLPGSSHYLVALEQADGKWDMEHNTNGGDSNDPYPTATVTAFDGSTTPNSHDYADADTECKIRNIQRSGTDILLDMTTSNATAPVSIQVSQQPTDTSATQAITPAVQVRLLDSIGQVVDWATQNVTVAIGTNPGTSTLSGTTTVAAVAGVATFPGLSLDKVGTGYTLRFSSAGCGDAITNAFNITAGAPTTLAFAVHPSNVAAGQAIAPPVEVQLYDAGGNPATGDNSTVVTVAIEAASNATGATLGGTLTATAIAGRAYFSDLTMNKVGTNYRLTAAITGVGPVPSNTFDVTAGAVDGLAVVASPGNGTAGVVLAPSAQVRVVDSFGNPVNGATNDITVELVTPSGTPPALGGTLTHAAVGGLATFNNLVVNQAGAGYTLRFTATGLNTAVSAAFDIAPNVAASLAWVQAPSNSLALTPISPSPTVELLDAYGNRATGDSTSTLRVALGTNTTGATLSGTLTKRAALGLVTFADLALDKVGTGYTLVAGGTGLAAVTSTGFDITPGAPTTMAIVVQPSNVAAGSPIAPAVDVQLYDGGGNPAAADNSTVVTMALQPASNTTGATLSGTATATASAGLARFAALSLDKVGTGYRLVASFTGATPVVSDPFDVTPGVATTLAMVTSPADGTAGVALAPAPQVRVLDALGNTVPTASVTAALQVPSGTLPTILGTTTQAAVAGVATFDDLMVNLVGTGYTLRFTSPGLTDAVSTAFAIAPSAATSMAWVQQPTAALTLAAIAPAPTVELLDAFGNRATGDSTTTLDVALGTNPSSATLSGGLSQTAAAGVVTFSGLSINRVGTGYTLTASGSGLASTASAAFNILGRTPDASKSTATLTPAVMGTDGQLATLRIVLHDSSDLPVQGNLPGTRSLVSDPATGLTATDLGAASDDNGVCEVRFSASTPGSYTVAPRIDSATLASSPLLVQS
ncbi:MAG: M6 family metalloprotease domain-containing protein, partial [Armatimonadetes bacterium]|nr:M6 family metalloprotease domain-containing protein [Armatimonadota bacterium]